MSSIVLGPGDAIIKGVFGLRGVNLSFTRRCIFFIRPTLIFSVIFPGCDQDHAEEVPILRRRES